MPTVIQQTPDNDRKLSEKKKKNNKQDNYNFPPRKLESKLLNNVQVHQQPPQSLSSLAASISLHSQSISLGSI